MHCEPEAPPGADGRQSSKSCKASSGSGAYGPQRASGQVVFGWWPLRGPQGEISSPLPPREVAAYAARGLSDYVCAGLRPAMAEDDEGPARQ